MVELWCAMDGRARFDIDAATVYEAYTTRPSWNELRRNWGDQDAVLVRFWGPSDKELTHSEVIGEIR